MIYDMENIIENIDFSMAMEDMPLTNEDKNRLRDCLNGKVDVDKILQEVIKKHTMKHLMENTINRIIHNVSTSE